VLLSGVSPKMMGKSVRRAEKAVCTVHAAYSENCVSGNEIP
jgi:hypothetical protein